MPGARETSASQNQHTLCFDVQWLLSAKACSTTGYGMREHMRHTTHGMAELTMQQASWNQVQSPQKHAT